MVTPEAAATAIGLDPHQIYAEVEAGTLHHLNSGDGSLLVCLRSALGRFG